MIPGRGNKIPHAVWHGKKKKKKIVVSKSSRYQYSFI